MPVEELVQIDHPVPTADSTANAVLSDVVGNKTDAAQTTVGTTRSIIAYVKGVLNQIATLLGYHAVPTANVDTNTQMRDVIGNKADTAVTTVGAVASLLAYVKGVLNQLATLTAPTGLTAFAPTLLNSTDLEAATKTINAVVEAVGVGNADYSYAGTVSVPGDAAMSVLRVATRWSFTSDSFNAGATLLSCRVYVDVQDADHLLFDTTQAAAANKLNIQDTTSSTKAVIFNLLKDGSPHTFYFFFWVDAGNVVISVCQLWAAVGSTTAAAEFLRITHAGEVELHGTFAAVSGGTLVVRVMIDGGTVAHRAGILQAAANATPTFGYGGAGPFRVLAATYVDIGAHTITTANDLIYITNLGGVRVG